MKLSQERYTFEIEKKTLLECSQKLLRGNLLILTLCELLVQLPILCPLSRQNWKNLIECKSVCLVPKKSRGMATKNFFVMNLPYDCNLWNDSFCRQIEDIDIINDNEICCYFCISLVIDDINNFICNAYYTVIVFSIFKYYCYTFSYLLVSVSYFV